MGLLYIYLYIYVIDCKCRLLFPFCCTEHTKPAIKKEVVRVSLPVHRIACVISIPETNVENVDQQSSCSDKYVSWVSASSSKKIQGDMGGKVNIL